MTDPNVVRAELRQKAFEHARRYLFDFTQMVFPEVEPAGSFIEARHRHCQTNGAAGNGRG